jgi:hypothetical protein
VGAARDPKPRLAARSARRALGRAGQGHGTAGARYSSNVPRTRQTTRASSSELLSEALSDESDRTAFVAFHSALGPSARRSSPPLRQPRWAEPIRHCPRAGNLNPQDRAKLEAALAPHVGPIARVLVERVAHEATDLAAASHTLATSLPEGEQRRTFLRTLTLVQPPARGPAPKKAPASAAATAAVPPPATKAAVAQRAPALPTQGLGGTQPLLGTLYLGEDVLKRAEQRLARALGPMARSFVRRAAKNARNAAELYAALAEELPEGPERDGFLASRDQA